MIHTSRLHTLRSAAAAAAVAILLTGCASDFDTPSDTQDSGSTAESRDFGGEAGAGPNGSADPVVTGSVPSIEPDTSAVVGNWAADTRDCEAPDAVVSISTSRFESPDRRCDVSDMIDAGDRAVTVTLACGADDAATGSELLKLTPQEDDTLHVTVIGGEGEEVLHRCP